MTHPIIGFIILGLVILSAVGGILFHHFMWNRKAPKNEYRGVRWEMLPGCIEWTDVEASIDTMFEMLDPKVLKDIWITITPWNRPIIGKGVPTGYLSAANGRSALPPKTEEEAKNVYILNGLTEYDKKWPIGASTAKVYVRQHRLGEGKIDARLLRGEFPVVPDAARSSLFHEVAAHVNPYRLGEGHNADHKRKDLDELDSAMRVATLNKSQQKK